MALRTYRWFRIPLVAMLAASFVLTPGARSATATMPAPQSIAAEDAPAPGAPDPRAEAMRLGTWPAQVAASWGDIQPNLHGPQRNDPAEGIPAHAYSPFDERRNREYPCPHGGCDYDTEHVLVKLAPGVRVASPTRQESGEFTSDVALNRVLEEHGIIRLDPIFPKATPPQPNEQITDANGQILPKPDLTRWYRAVLKDDETEIYTTVAALADTPGVAWAEPDYLRKPVGETNATGMLGVLAGDADSSHVPQSPAFTDPLYDQQWHLPAVHAPEAWAYLQSQGLPPGGSPDVVVAVIDTGVDYTHPDLAANMWVNAPEFGGVTGVDDDGNGYIDDTYGADTVTPDGNPQDDHGHGTHVAGIIAAQADNGIGGVGVAYTSRIMALKAAQYSGVLAASDIAEAIYYAVEKGAQVINMSFGGYARSQVEEDALAVAFGQAVLVAAAGNDAKVNLPCPFGRDMYPAAYNWVLGVMARDQNPDAGGNYLAGFSNYDCEAQDTHEYELMAPGADIWSLLPAGQYAAWDGTSMAAPVVSGLAALARTRWNDIATYSSRFIMGQLVSTGPMLRAYTLPDGSPVDYRTPDGVTALTDYPQPQLSYLQHWLFDTTTQASTNDGDGIVDAGETIDLAIIVRNHWGKAEPVTVTLDAWATGAGQPDPYVTVITGTVPYGAIGSFSQDDNGLIYDSQGAVIGVQYPFRFSVDPDTPNDHAIPFRLTIIAGNGFDPADPNAPYTFESNFYLLVQRGRELPRLINHNMTLTKDDYWLIPDATLIEAGSILTVTQGTQLQFFSIDPGDPYSQIVRPYLQVEGALRIQGTAAEPVEMFTGVLYPSYPIQIRKIGAGATHLRHARIENPVIGGTNDIYTNAGGGLPLDSVDHAYFNQDTYDKIRRYSYYSTPPHWDATNQPPIMRATTIGRSIFDGLGYEAPYYYLHVTSPVETSLFDSSVVRLETQSNGSVFLKNHKLRTYGIYNWTSKATTGRLNGGLDQDFTDNAILNFWWHPGNSYWMQFVMDASRGNTRDIDENFWGTTSTTLIDASINDFYDDFNLGIYQYQPVLTTPPESAYPFVADVVLSTAFNSAASIIGAEHITFTVSFNRDMDTVVQPLVSFGPDEPYTDFTVPGDWTNARTWQGSFNVTPVTGDGYQLVRIAGARAAGDPWLITGDDAGRFRFEIVTSGTNAMNLQATGGEGYIDLMWTQTDFDLRAGYNLYKSTSQNGTYTRINQTIIPPAQHTYHDTAVQPGVPAYYKFTVVKSDMSESDYSNVAAATPIDTIPPAISHTPVTQAPPGLSLSLFADVTDNVGVQNVTLFYRAMGATPYQSLAMVHTTANRYSATIPGSAVTAPGLEYYIEASDGISTVRSGRPEYPHQVIVSDRPTVISVTPNRGPAGGGTAVTIAGSNFKPGATVTFGGAACGDVIVASSSQITCSTPPHYPSAVDVTVTNPVAQSGTLLNAFTFESGTASLSLPDTGGRQHAVVQVPINAADVQGMAAASLKVAFDPVVIQALGASAGSLTPGWSVVANTVTPGEIRLSLASPGGTVSGSGVLAVVQFDVVGSPGQISALTLHDVLLNDGAIPTQTAAGSFQVEQVYDVTGHITFWNGGVVSDTLLTLTGDRIYTALSDQTGAYTVGGAAADDYLLTPSKAGEANGISAYDASLAMQHDAGVITLGGHAATAADVNRSGAITSMDAFHILQKSVDLITLPFPGAGAVWFFDPASRSYANLSSNLSDQNFTAILLGDVSGNWTPDAPEAFSDQISGSVALSLTEVVAAPGERITITLAASLDQAELLAADLAVAYDPAVLALVSVTPGAAASGFMAAINTSQAGRLALALAGATPMTTGGDLFILVFDVASQASGESAIAFERAEINEGTVSAQTDDGSVTVVHRVNLALTSGWNLLTLPLSPRTAMRAQTLLDALNGQGGACSEIDRWLNGGWDVHVNGLPANDFVVEPGQGYFLKCTAASQWTLEGFTYDAAVPLTLQPGLNLVGVPYPPAGYTAQSLLDAIAAQGGACSEVNRWRFGAWDAHIDGLPFNDFAIEPDQGYFVKCSQASTFTPGTGLEVVGALHGRSPLR